MAEEDQCHPSQGISEYSGLHSGLPIPVHPTASSAPDKVINTRPCGSIMDVEACLIHSVCLRTLVSILVNDSSKVIE